MQFSSVQDVNAPLDFVFQQLSDFESYESYALRTGADVDREDALAEKATGMFRVICVENGAKCGSNLLNTDPITC